MEILLVSGGSPQQWPDLKVSDYDLYVGIDRGSFYIVEQDWPLTLAVGDFDSLTKTEKEAVFQKALKVVTANPEKDDTDTQLALACVFEQWPQANVTLIGATGGRLDHLLANLWLGLETRFQPFLSQIRIADKQNDLKYYAPGEYRVQQLPGFTYLAYCCLTPVKNLTLTDSKYLLNHVDTAGPVSYASNEFINDSAKFSFDQGMIAVIQSKD